MAWVTAVAQVWSLAQELPHAEGAAKKEKKKEYDKTEADSQIENKLVATVGRGMV